MSPAVTVYTTGPPKLLAVVPLTCIVLPTLTDAPVVVKVAAKAVTSVPNGTVAEIVVPLMVPATVDERAALASVKLNAVISLELLFCITETVTD